MYKQEIQNLSTSYQQNVDKFIVKFLLIKILWYFTKKTNLDNLKKY